MIKAHSYDKQLFFSVAHRLVNNIFLNKQNGVVSGIGNECSVSKEGTNLTVKDGFFIVQGGILEVVEKETIAIPSVTNKKASLIYEINLANQNTDEKFNQGVFKIVVSSTSEYPTLIQEKLTENSGVYQVLFANLDIVSSTSITVHDKRFFIDYEGIYNYIKKQIVDIKNNNTYFLKENILVVEYSFKPTRYAYDDGEPSHTVSQLVLPTGWTYENCVLLSFTYTFGFSDGIFDDPQVNDDFECINPIYNYKSSDITYSYNGFAETQSNITDLVYAQICKINDSRAYLATRLDYYCKGSGNPNKELHFRAVIMKIENSNKVSLERLDFQNPDKYQ